MQHMMKSSHLKIFSLILIFIVGLATYSTAQVSPDAGKTLFKNYCAACHTKDMRSAATGPALGGAQERWADDKALYAWIRNSQAVIASGHPRAVEMWNQYKPTIMTAFPDLTDDEIGSMLAYINGTYDGTYGAKAVAAGAGPIEPEKPASKWPLYLGLFAALGVLSYVLSRIINNLDRIGAAKEGRIVEEKSLMQTLTSKGVISFLLFALVVLGGYTMVNNATNLSRQQGYAPDQPIKFSHETHAGINKIDCQYCHDGARRSKHSVIPAANTCMNCHSAIKSGSKYGTAEITKIYASIGYNPINNTYIDNYDNYPQDSIKKVYTDWITANYIDKNEIAAIDADGVLFVEDQWNDIVSSLTNEQKKKVQGPIEWTRIHNLPDHVYFNHSQHVTVGKLECQTCHGKVEEMEVASQASPLSMGWCVNCHRQTAVQFNDNEYYKSYEKYHEEMASGKREKVTVSDIGGLECQKCHY
jgi:mono/diheme cytochrome c family protein